MSTEALQEVETSENGETTSVDNALQRLADILSGGKKKEKEYKDMNIRWEGKQIILPVGMSPASAREWIERYERREEKVIDLTHSFDAYPHDGLVALKRAIDKTFGYAAVKGQRMMWFEQPPRFVNVPVGPNQKEEVTLDQLAPPALEGGTIQAGWDLSGEKPEFTLRASLKRKYSHLFDDLAEAVQWELENNSIYKGKAIKVGFDYVVQDRDFNFKVDQPRFFGQGILEDNETLILNDTVEFDLTTNVWLRIERREHCLANDIPLTHGALFTGEYGVGKTMAGRDLARRCVKNDVTYVYLEDSGQLSEAIQFARTYAPAVIFAEDIDKATKERNNRMNDLLNVISGVEENEEIIVVLTTNHPEDIDSSFMRAGRIDTVIEFERPDAKSAQRFAVVYGKTAEGESVLAEDIDMEEVGKALSDMPPAFIAEAVKKAKTYAMYRENTADIAGLVQTEDLVTAATSLQDHVARAERRQHDEQPPLSEQWTEDLVQRTKRALADDDLHALQGTVDEICDTLERAFG